MLKLLGDVVLILCGVYFISLGLAHVRPQVAGGIIFLGVMLFLDDFLSGRATTSLLMRIAGIGVGIL